MFNVVIESINPNTVAEGGQIEVNCVFMIDPSSLDNNTSKDLGIFPYGRTVNNDGPTPEFSVLELKDMLILGLDGTANGAPLCAKEADVPSDWDWAKCYYIYCGEDNKNETWVINLNTYTKFRVIMTFTVKEETKSGDFFLGVDFLSLHDAVPLLSAEYTYSLDTHSFIKIIARPEMVTPNYAERPVINSFQINPVAGEECLILGEHFGTTPGLLLIGTLTIPMSRIKYWTDSQILVNLPRTIPAGIALFRVKRPDINIFSLPVVASIEGIIKPTITSTSVTGPLNKGEVHNITLYGKGFTSPPGTVMFGSNALIVSNWSDKEIECVIPSTASTESVCVVTNEGNLSNNVLITLVAQTPSITSIVPDIVEEGKDIAIIGTGFGATEGVINLSSASSNLIVKSWGPEAIIAEVGYGSEPGVVTVTTNLGVVSNNYPVSITTVETQDMPQILRISPAGGPQGSTIKIAGKNFGTYKSGSCYAMIGNVSLELVQGAWSANEVSAKIPVGAKTSYLRVINSAGESNEAMFIVSDEPLKDDVVVHPKPPVAKLQPQITKVDPAYYAPGNSKITIFGRNLGKTAGQVKAGSLSIQVVPGTWTNEFVQVILPTNPQKLLLQIINSNGVSNKVSYMVTAPIPKILSISPANNNVNGEMTINGTNFGTGLNEANCYLRTGNESDCVIPRTAITTWTDTQIKLTLPANLDYTGNRIQVIADNLKSEWKSISVSYDGIVVVNDSSSSGDIRNTLGQLVVKASPSIAPITGVPVGAAKVSGFNADKLGGLHWSDIKEYIDSKFKNNAVLANELHTINGVEPGSDNDIKLCGAGNIEILKNEEGHEIIIVMNPLEGQNTAELLAKLGSVIVNTGNIAGVDATDGFVSTTNDGIVTLSIDWGMGPNQVPPGDHTHPENERIPVYQ